MMGKNLNKILGTCSYALVLLIALAGCKKQDQQAPPGAPTPPAAVSPPGAQSAVQKPMSAAKTNLPVQGQVSSSSKPARSVSIDFSNRKDPFKPAIVELTPAAGKGGRETAPNPNLLPIQRVEVEKFKITGIIAGLKENRALLVDPDGKAYVAKTGMLIGPNNGKVTRITANTLEVDENFKDDAGRIKKRTVKLTLQRKK